MEYPEHEKLSKIRNESQSIGEFLEWLSTKGVILCMIGEEGWYPASIHKSAEKWLSEYFDIDLRKLEAEKLQMLKAQRKLNERTI